MLVVVSVSLSVFLEELLQAAKSRRKNAGSIMRLFMTVDFNKGSGFEQWNFVPYSENI